MSTTIVRKDGTRLTLAHVGHGPDRHFRTALLHLAWQRFLAVLDRAAVQSRGQPVRQSCNVEAMHDRPRPHHKRSQPLANEADLKSAVRRECRRQLEAFLLATDPESGLLMVEVLAQHAARGFGINVGISVRHPDEPKETAP